MKVDKNIVREELKKIKEQIKLNSKDAHFAENLISELELNTKKLLHENTLLDVGKEEETLKGDTFELTRTSKGIIYHTYGGYNIFVTPNNNALYEMLNDYIVNQEIYNKLEGEEKQQFETTLSAVTYCLNVPLIVFTNADLTFKIATDVVSYLRELQSKMLDSELQEETVAEDEQFKNAVTAIDNIKDEIKNSVEQQ